MKISLITVCYNAEKTIEDTIRSVLSQDYPDIEYIIIDGASQDKTLAIAERYRSRLAHLVSEPDKGIYDAMNKGIALAGGEVIGLLNADDVYVNERVISKVAAAMQKESLDALYGDLEFFDGRNPGKTLRRYRSAWFRPSRIAWGWMPAHPTLFLRREIYQEFGGFRTHYRIAGDFEFIARIFHGNTLHYKHLPEVLVRMRTGGVSTRGFRSTCLLNREVMQACREAGIATNWFMILSKYPIKLLDLVFK